MTVTQGGTRTHDLANGRPCSNQGSSAAWLSQTVRLAGHFHECFRVPISFQEVFFNLNTITLSGVSCSEWKRQEITPPFTWCGWWEEECGFSVHHSCGEGVCLEECMVACHLLLVPRWKWWYGVDCRGGLRIHQHLSFYSHSRFCQHSFSRFRVGCVAILKASSSKSPWVHVDVCWRHWGPHSSSICLFIVAFLKLVCVF